MADNGPEKLMMFLSVAQEQANLWKTETDSRAQKMVEMKQENINLKERIESLQKEIQIQSTRLVMIIDGDGAIFDRELISLGRKGGENAARDLADHVQNYFKSNDSSQFFQSRVYIFFNKQGLGKALRTKGHLEDAPAKLDEFQIGFNTASPRFLMVDVGGGKEAADHKVKAFLEDEIRSPQTYKIIFGGGCHDNGYAQILQSYITAGLKKKLVLLQTYEKIEPGFSALGLDIIPPKPGLFIPKKLEDPPAAGPLNPIPGSPKVRQVHAGSAIAPGVPRRSDSANPGSYASIASTSPPKQLTVTKPQASSPGSEANNNLNHNIGRTITLDKTKTLYQLNLDPKPCVYQYLGKDECNRGTTCKFSHRYALSPDHIAELRKEIKARPCDFLLEGAIPSLIIHGRVLNNDFFLLTLRCRLPTRGRLLGEEHVDSPKICMPEPQICLGALRVPAGATDMLSQLSFDPVEDFVSVRSQPPPHHSSRNMAQSSVSPGGGASASGPSLSLHHPNVPGTGDAPKASKKKRKRRNKGKNANQNAGNSVARLPVPARAFPRFNDLPIELQETIFKIATDGVGEERIRPLMDISPKIKEWHVIGIHHIRIIPRLIELPCCHSCDDDDDDDNEVTVRDQSELALYQALLETKPKEFFVKSARWLYTDSREGPLYRETELKLLSVCDNLEVLECWSKGPNEELTGQLMKKCWPKLKLLGINIDLLPRDDHTFHIPLFQNVTHLDLKSNDPQIPSALWKGLKSLLNLTHMRINTMEKFKWTQKEEAADHAYAMAKEVKGYLPRKLKHFVILIPVDVLYNMWTEVKEHGNEKRWRRLQSIRLGSFSPRIMLGCVLDRDLDRWMDNGDMFEYSADLDDLEEFGESWLYTTPIVINPTEPRGFCTYDGNPYGNWEEVDCKNRPGERG
ncbi:hypothetical protein NP233_g5002 [Leucocoprinus birnbaumii]|uniref:C3H1-type domain-containing protein n=1 Tax=Leucocoprinus birnbaumii TaxID=56174 RepID=A0AAD5YX41_9AGAR|nr:hypothetical protein NP233_g5002 [Leucocoprinus birnbaumii]